MPLHIKNVTTINIAAVTELAAGTDLASKWHAALRFLSEPYDKVPKPDMDDIAAARFTEDEMEQLLRAGHIEPTEYDEAEGTVRVFVTNEAAKHRYRIIKHTKDINDNYGKDTLLGTTFLAQGDLHQSVHKGK